MLHEYKTTTNMSEQFSPLVAIAQNPGKICDDALVDFCGKLLHHFLVNFHIFDFVFGIILLMLGMSPYHFEVQVWLLL